MRMTLVITSLTPGRWLHNPATGEIAHLLSADADGRRAEVDLWLQPGAAVQVGARFASMIEAIWSLGALGRVNAKGLPDPLWLAAIAREYSDTIRFVKPPAIIQTLLFGPLAAVARRTGRDPLAPELHGPEGACSIPDPGEEGLAALLAQGVQTRAARRGG